MKVKLKVITPLHIGSGEKYSALEYIYEYRTLKRYNIDKITQKAKEKNLLSALASYFKSGVSPNRKVHSLREIYNSNPILGKAISEVEPEYIIKAELKREEEVEEFIKSNGKIYIPGSEIKGSIRRGLLLYVLKRDEQLLKRFLGELRRIKGKKELKTFGEQIENIVFRGGNKNAQQDILKFLRVSDTNPIQPSEKNLKVKEVGVFYIKSEKRNSFFSEVVLPGTLLEFDISIPAKIKEFVKAFNCHNLIKELFLNSNNEKTTIERIIEIWKEAEKECIKCDPYLVPVSNSEIMDSVGNNKRALQIVKFIQQLKEGKRPVVRIGKHEGYLFTTVMALLKERDEKLFERIFKISVPRVSGIPNKTRKLTIKEKLPLGFCTVEIV